MFRIWVDFTYSTKLLPLRFKGSFVDIRKQKITLQEGMHIVIYDDQCEAEAIVEKRNGEWWARVVGEIANDKNNRPPTEDDE